MPATVIKWHGGKGPLASKLVRLMAPHLHYCEPFAGGLSVLFNKDPTGISEVVNDIDGRLVGFWRALQDPDLFERFRRTVEAVPFSEREWVDAEGRLDDPDPVRRAVAFFVRCRQSLAGRMDAFASLSRDRVRRQMNEQASAWLTCIEGLPAVHARLKRVVILNRDALDVIRREDGPKTLHYLDPPYLPSTRTAREVYAHEMTVGQHRELLDVVRGCRGKVMLSGYPSALYDRELAGWRPEQFQVANHAAGGKSKRRAQEVVWLNY